MFQSLHDAPYATGTADSGSNRDQLIGTNFLSAPANAPIPSTAFRDSARHAAFQANSTEPISSTGPMRPAPTVPPQTKSEAMFDFVVSFFNIADNSEDDVYSDGPYGSSDDENDYQDYYLDHDDEDASSDDEQDDTPAHINLHSFTSAHLVPLFPDHTSYFQPKSPCAICKESYSMSHPLFWSARSTAAKAMSLGTSVRRAIGSVMDNGNKCPLCRTVRYHMGRKQLRALGRQWDSVVRKEDEIDAGGGGGETSF
jgi:hypothetical protein